MQIWVVATNYIFEDTRNLICQALLAKTSAEAIKRAKLNIIAMSPTATNFQQSCVVIPKEMIHYIMDLDDSPELN